MPSLYEDLARKLSANPGPSRGGGPRFDISVLLFNSRGALNELWLAADRHVRVPNSGSTAALREAVEALRPLFGDPSRQPPSP
ncbi:MAG: hypothetical protein M9925_14285 [Chloroflexi bacterium]|nr:hypothetical protein [Chloroflexota bacterium]